MSEIFIKGFDDATFAGLSVGHHFITFQFTPTGSSQPLCQQSYQVIIRPTSKCVTCLSLYTYLTFLFFKLFIQ